MGSWRGSPSISTKPIVTRVSGAACGGCFGCGDCANAAVAKPATMAALSRRTNLLIDHDAPGNAAGRNGHRRLAAAHIDDRHVVAETVGDIECAFVAGKGGAPGPLADQDVAPNLAGRHVDHCHMSRV